MVIADYLECPLAERNDLLLAAQYLPEQPMWEGDALRQAFEQAQQIMETLPYPAIMVTHLYQVQAANKFFLHLLDSPSLEALPLHQRSMMHLIFHTGTRRSTMINAEEHATWQKHALYAIQHFKQQNMLYQYDFLGIDRAFNSGAMISHASGITGNNRGKSQAGLCAIKADICSYGDNRRDASHTCSEYVCLGKQQNLSGSCSTFAGR